uniref:Uncharacterized protein n=1 Tax=Romanomermis culicivorax TaxID=13658 RepID=A0A915HUK7_ROMCU
MKQENITDQFDDQNSNTVASLVRSKQHLSRQFLGAGRLWNTVFRAKIRRKNRFHKQTICTNMANIEIEVESKQSRVRLFTDVIFFGRTVTYRRPFSWRLAELAQKFAAVFPFCLLYAAAWPKFMHASQKQAKL